MPSSASASSAFDQHGYTARFEWGLAGARTLAAAAVDVLVIVDVLSFTTAVTVAVDRGAVVYPYPSRDDTAAAFAARLDAILAVPRHQTSAEQPYALSPASLKGVPAGTRLVLPSPNGSAISAAAQEWGRLVLAGCLRNAWAVANVAAVSSQTIGVVAAGERWPDGSLRPCFEDLVGAGAILNGLPSAARSPEAEAAAAAFQAVQSNLPAHLMACASGRELCSRGYAEDVRMATELNVSRCVPRLRDGAYQA